MTSKTCLKAERDFWAARPPICHPDSSLCPKVRMSTLFDGHGIKLFDGLPTTGSGVL
jgi:hypothetical protein